MDKILYLAPFNLGKRDGGGLAARAFYDALCHLYPGRVDMLMPREYCGGRYAEAVPVPPRPHWKALLSGSIHRYRRFMQAYLEAHRGEYGFCVINGGIYAGDMMDLIHRAGLRIMVIHHNFECEYHKGSRDLLTLGGIYGGLVSRVEHMAYSRADVNCFLTQADINLFEQAYGTRPVNCLLGVFEPKDIERPVLRNTEPGNIIAITGSMDTVQTERGVLDFSQHYYKCFRNLLPDWSLRIAGRNPVASIQDFARQHADVVELIPNPPDMTRVVETCRIFLCPTHVGGGLKLRVMDGLRQGLPVLTHAISARGYDTFYGEPFFASYCDEASFRNGLCRLSSLPASPDLQRSIQDAYFSVFGFESGVERMWQAFETFKNL